MSHIDLSELARRESERVEWKENVADIDDVVKTAVAFANDFSNLGGGYIVCGAKESKNAAGFQSVDFVGLTASRLKEVEGKVVHDCRKKVDPPIVPLVEELPTADPDKRVVVFLVATTPNAHAYRASGKDASTYYIRVGRDTVEAKNGLLRELLARKNVVEPWDRRACIAASAKDIDLLALRDNLQSMAAWDPARPVDEYLSAEQSISSFVPPLMARDRLSGQLVPRNLTILMFGSAITRFVPGAYSILSSYPGEDRSEPIAERIEITGTLVEQARRLIERVNVESSTVFDKNTPTPNQQKYPQRALQEAIVNALVHRDFESDQPTRITIFSDRIEINSPGALPRAVDKAKFLDGKAFPYWRNQSLAFFFNKLQLAQAEGQGIPTIIRTMRELGSPRPVFEAGESNVVCVLPAHPRHKMLRQLRDIENSIILGNHHQALAMIEPILLNDPLNFRAIELFCQTCALLDQPERVLEFVRKSNVDPKRLSPSSAIFVAETLLTIERNPEARTLAEEWLVAASKGRLEENEIKKVAIGIRKIGKPEQVIRFIDEAIKRISTLRDNAAVIDIRAKAKIDLAKRCTDTGRNVHVSPQLRKRAWEECRDLLDSAEIDLNKALETVTDRFDRDWIEKDLEFLMRMKEIAKKPSRPSSGRRGRPG